MRLYIKQKIFSWVDKFTVKEESGADRYSVHGEFLSWGKTLHICNSQGEEVALVQQKVFSFLPRFYVFVGGRQVAEIVKEFTFFKPRYRIDGLGWTVEGDFFAHDYTITENGSSIVSISKTWMTWGDCYELNIWDTKDEVVALAVVLAIDCVLAQSNN